jgi:hypothetical protein
VCALRCRRVSSILERTIEERSVALADTSLLVSGKRVRITPFPDFGSDRSLARLGSEGANG